MFPKHNIEHDNKIAVKNLLGKAPKLIEFAPMFFCEFFEGLDVMQIYSEKTKEYLFGIYAAGRLVGHCYFGDKYTPKQLADIADCYLPKKYDEMKEYRLKHTDIWYHKPKPSQYAWIYENILEKIE
ncbi:hypothetical protein [Riemerella anatipestifer]|uniref:Uncharacterized protein n=1 Tax=Riemerella anatipestifer TaxID=34085 RepID=A0A1S7DQT9_RIEAN|nr:hypothetical protein [Riemerella anatipestifer]AQY21467.1 hypothetical protein AB406_0509 [Riemerella anatipestifer]MDD1538587.1 hypothetical protein [Riemerella anatipestifer]